jgi:hypothetical protein
MQGTCIDPNFPYCDVDGSVDGEPGVCIAVTCTAGTFSKCDGDSAALTCNSFGNGYDSSQCAHGCDQTTGCRLCEANQTVCANGTVATCDANGSQTSTTMCALGCFEDQPRCRDIVPSNGLATYYDATSAPTDLIVPAGKDAQLDATAGTITLDGNVLPIATYLMSAPPGGVPIRVFVADHVTISGRLIAMSTRPANAPTGEAVAILANHDFLIEGVALNFFTGYSTAPACQGGKGTESDNTGVICGGAGGGGNATAGAPGGGVNYAQGVAGGAAGGACGGVALIPLLGGGAAGDMQTDINSDFAADPSGGGAFQFVSRTKLTVTGVINVDGGAGYFGQVSAMGTGVGGGGAGGGVLLEAPSVELGGTAALLARGGGGEAGDTSAGTVTVSAYPIPGGVCLHPSAGCQAGGAGAAVNVPATAGGTASGIGGSGGGGGGGLGRIRINTVDGNYAKTNSTVEAGALTTGMIQTR